MKKLLLVAALAISCGAYGGNTFNTLDTAPAVTIGAIPTGTNSIGQVTANAGTNLNTSALALDASVTATTGTKAAGTAATSSVLGGGVYNSTLPAPTTGQQTALQVDATGRLRVNASEVASGATDSGNPLKVGGVYNSTMPTFTNGQRGDLQISTRGALGVSLFTPDSNIAVGAINVTADANVNARGLFTNSFGLVSNGTTWDRMRGDTTGLYVVEQASAVGGYSFSNLKANATTTVKSGAGKLHTISINTKGLTNTVTVYDNTAGSGTTIATIDTTLGQDTLTFDLAFATGLTIVIAGGTAADITVTYK